MQCPKCGYMMDAFEKDCPRCAKVGAAPSPPDQPIQPRDNSLIQPVQPIVAKSQPSQLSVSAGRIVGGVITAIVLLIVLGSFLDKGCGGFSQQVVTMEKYNQIQKGMSYQQVCDIIGSEGESMAENQMEGVPGYIPSVTTKMFMWQNPSGSNMNVMLQNDRVVSKAQAGLD